jgi:alpha-tubulin suppressor-like RCC1 family protein
MKNRKMLLMALLSMVLVFSLILPTSLAVASAAAPVPDGYPVSRSTLDWSGLASTMVLDTPAGNKTPMVAAGNGFTVGLKADATVVAVGYNEYGQRDVGGWTDITQVAAGYDHTVGLKSDGTVAAVGDNEDGQCNVGGWTDITQVAAASFIRWDLSPTAPWPP